MSTEPRRDNAPDHAWYGRLEGKIDVLLDHSIDHERRLRSLERARAWATGVGAAILAGIGALFKFHGKG